MVAQTLDGDANDSQQSGMIAGGGGAMFAGSGKSAAHEW
jgi:hypothetical protein